MSVLYGLYLCSDVAFVVHALAHDLNTILLLNTAYNFNVPLVAAVLTFWPFVYVTVVPSWLVLHHANVHPLGAVPHNVAYVVKFFATPYVWLDDHNFVFHAVVLLFP